MHKIVASSLVAITLVGCSCETTNAPADSGRDAFALADTTPAIDAFSAVDAFSTDDAFAESDAPIAQDAPESDAGMCTLTGYPITYAATPTERIGVEAAAAAFIVATGASVELNPSTLAVTGMRSGTIPIVLDGTIADPCERAFQALRAFFAANDAMMHVPADVSMRVCSYDDISNSEIVRLHGGTYAGRPIIGNHANDFLAHVSRTGTLRLFNASYTPNYERPSFTPCLPPGGLSNAVVGENLTYQRFSACVPGGGGSIAIDSSDTRNVGEPKLFITDSGTAHYVREVEVLLAASRVTPELVNSDLFCCTGDVGGCVGNILIVDEITGDVLTQYPRCHTC